MNLDKGISFILLDSSVQRQKNDNELSNKQTNKQTNKKRDSVQLPKVAYLSCSADRDTEWRYLGCSISQLSDSPLSLSHCGKLLVRMLNGAEFIMLIAVNTRRLFKWIKTVIRDFRNYATYANLENKKHFITPTRDNKHETTRSTLFTMGMKMLVVICCVSSTAKQCMTRLQWHIQLPRFFSPGNDVSFLCVLKPTGLGCLLLRHTQL